MCSWDGIHRIEHVDCKSPQEPNDALKRAAEEKALRATKKP
jgi:hypothetical protein